MWESRPLPKIVRDPLAAFSARGSFFVPGPPGIFFVGEEERAAELPPALLRPLMSRRSRQEAAPGGELDRGAPQTVVSKGGSRFSGGILRAGQDRRQLMKI